MEPSRRFLRPSVKNRPFLPHQISVGAEKASGGRFAREVAEAGGFCPRRCAQRWGDLATSVGDRSSLQDVRPAERAGSLPLVFDVMYHAVDFRTSETAARASKRRRDIFRERREQVERKENAEAGVARITQLQIGPIGSLGKHVSWAQRNQPLVASGGVGPAVACGIQVAGRGQRLGAPSSCGFSLAYRYYYAKPCGRLRASTAAA